PTRAESLPGRFTRSATLVISDGGMLSMTNQPPSSNVSPAVLRPAPNMPVMIRNSLTGVHCHRPSPCWGLMTGTDPLLGAPDYRFGSPARPDVVLDSLFRQHHDVASRSQLLDAGLTGRMIDARVARGDDALASHRSAGWLWGLVEDLLATEVTVPHSRSARLAGVTTHRVRA